MLLDPLPVVRAARRDRVPLRRPGGHRLPGRTRTRSTDADVGRLPVHARQPEGPVRASAGPHGRLPPLVRRVAHATRDHATAEPVPRRSGGERPCRRRARLPAAATGSTASRPIAFKFDGRALTGFARRHARLGAARQRRRRRRAEHLRRPAARDHDRRRRGAERARPGRAGRPAIGADAPGDARRARGRAGGVERWPAEGPAGRTTGTRPVRQARTPTARSWSSAAGAAGLAAARRRARRPGDPRRRGCSCVEADPASRVPRGRVLADTTALGVYDHGYVTAVQRRPTPRTEGRLWHIRAGRIVLATGAIERPIVFADNDRPGIMLAGAAATYSSATASGPGRGPSSSPRTTSTDRRRPTVLRAAGVEIAADRRRAPGRGRCVGHRRRRRRSPRRRSRSARARRRPARTARGRCGPAARLGRLEPQRLRCGARPAARSASTSGSPRSSRTGPDRTAGSRPSAPRPATSRPRRRRARSGSSRPPPRPGRRRRLGDPLRRPPARRDRRATCVARSAPASPRSSTSSATRRSARRPTRARPRASWRRRSRRRSSARRSAPSACPTFRPPYVPVSFAQLAGRDRGDLLDPIRTTPIHDWHVAARRGVRGRRPVEAAALLPARRRVDGGGGPARMRGRADRRRRDGCHDARQDRPPGPGRRGLPRPRLHEHVLDAQGRVVPVRRHVPARTGWSSTTA